MNLSADASLERLAAHDHGVLATTHATRGVDAVPVVYALVDGYIGIPIDRVKPKTATRLQRERNLERDPRATLLIEHWDRENWSALWWVRAQLRWIGATPESGADGLGEAMADRLADRYRQYHARPFTRILVLRIDGIVGWSAG